MKKCLENIRTKWYLYVASLILLAEAGVFLIFRENSYIQVHDNLDLFVAHFQIMKNENAFFAHGVNLPLVGGVTRDVFGSEFSLYNALYILLPSFAAYLTGYALKIAIGIFSFTLLAKDVYGERYAKYRPIAVVIAVAFALIPVFPTYGIAFTSVPFIVWLLRRLYYEKSRGKRVILYIGVFLYPLLSYFSYHGFFILAYMVCAVIILWIRDKKFPLSTALSVVILAAGYVCFEYRLFSAMLFSDTVTIRSSMVNGDMTFAEAMKEALNVFLNAQFHCQDSHLYVVLPVCIVGLVIINVGYIKRHEARGILTDSANLVFGWIVFNCLICGLYQFAPFRQLIETLIPKLVGFQFDRTLYFNTFLWYALLFLVIKRLYDADKSRFNLFGNVVACIAVLIVMLEPQMYNDFYSTCYNQAYRIIKGSETSTINYREFYSTELFDKVKADIGYDGEWSAAYGMHPAVIEYNGFKTLDGYIGMYSEEYKNKWREVISPSFDTAPGYGEYFMDWGPRAYIYPPDDSYSYGPYRELVYEDNRLPVNADALRALDCRYVLSRIALGNAEELGLTLRGEYTDDSSPYTIYVYEL